MNEGNATVTVGNVLTGKEDMDHKERLHRPLVCLAGTQPVNQTLLGAAAV